MILTIPFVASELKKELISFGVKVLMCKATRYGNAVIAVEGSLFNVNLFIDFCNKNNYVNALGKSFMPIKENCEYVNYGNIYKI